MYIKKKLRVVLLIALMLVLPSGSLFAASSDFQTNADSTLSLTNPSVDLVVKSGATVETLAVSENTVSATLLPGSTITIEAPSGYDMSWGSYSAFSYNCPTSGASSLTLNAPLVSTVVTVTVTTGNCTSKNAVGGSSGGTTTTPPPAVPEGAPTNGSVVVSANAVDTTNNTVELTLSANNATEMKISNQASFEGIEWETYATSKTWALKSGLGKKTVYVKFKNNSGESALSTDSILLVPAPASKAITASVGGHLGLPDDVVAVDLLSDTLDSNGTLYINPTTSFTSPKGDLKVLGEQAYDLLAEADGKSVKNFNKNVTVSIKYTDEQIKDLSASTLSLYYYNNDAKEWIKLSSVVNKSNKVVSAETNHFTLFALLGSTTNPNGKLVKLECNDSNASICTSVYYLGNNGKRYVFPNSKVYFSWYDDFSNVETISAVDLASYVIGGNVTYKPGVKMVKINTDTKVYAVSKNGTLKWVKTEALAKELYGNNWNTLIDDVPDAFFFSYTIGSVVESSVNFSKTAELDNVTSINVDKGL